MIDPDVPVERPRGSFLGHVNVVMLTYVTDGALALLTSILIARELGPDGRGAYGLFVLSAAFGQLLLGLGVGTAAIYYVNRGESTVRDALGAANVVTLLAAAVAMVFAVVLGVINEGDVLGGIPTWMLALAVPSLLYWNLMRLLLQAQSRFVDLAAGTIAQQAALLGVIIALITLGELTPARAAICLVLATAFAAALSLWRVGLRHLDVGLILRPDWAWLRRFSSFGLKGEAGNILQLLNYRLDQYLVKAFVGLAGVGIYAVGASLTEAIFILANSVALVLLPRLTADHEEAVWMTPLATRNTLLLAGVGAIGLAAVAPILVPAAFGEAYEDSVQALWLLLPGTVALAGSKVLTSYIFSQGKPLVNTAITALSLAVTVVADLALIPILDVNGAAIASSLAYITHFAAALLAYGRLSGQAPLSALVPGRADVRLYRDTIARLRSRGSNPPAEADRAHQA